MDVAVDLVVFAWHNASWNVLLVKRKYPPFEGRWAIPGGFVENDEDLSDAVLRELEEETGVQLSGVYQIGAFGQPKRDPRKRVVSVTYCAVLHRIASTQAGDDAAESVWHPVNQLPELAFDHDVILKVTTTKMQEYYALKKELPSSGPLEEEAVEAFSAIEL